MTAPPALELSPAYLQECLAGRRLLGDDFTPQQIEAWFAQERDAYADLGALRRDSYRYRYHALNEQLGFRRLPGDRRFPATLSVGGAYGDEVLPIMDRIDRLTILDSSTRYDAPQLGRVVVDYQPASSDGRMPFVDESFDLLCCFGVLQYVPNVTAVMREFHRVLRPGAYALLREVTTSLGDWRAPRPGLSRWERGVPRGMLREIAQRARFTILHETPCIFPPVVRLAFGASVGYNWVGVVAADRVLSRLFAWNATYHARSWYQKLRPSSVYLVLRRD